MSSLAFRIFFYQGVALFSVALAQQFATISGELATGTGPVSGVYSIELVSPATHMPVERAASSPDGKFEFQLVAPGNYTIYVKTENGQLVGFQDVSTFSGQLRARIQISAQPQTKPIAGTVSASTLLHRPPKKAIRELNAGIRAHKNGDEAAVESHLLAAIRLDPDFSEAHTNLGAHFAGQGNLPAAYSEFQTALRLGPKEAMQYTNFAVTAAALNRYDEAERNLRLALSVDSRYAKANYLLGKILARQPGHREEAVKRLNLAAQEMPAASDQLRKLAASLR